MRGDVCTDDACDGVCVICIFARARAQGDARVAARRARANNRLRGVETLSG